MDRAEAEAIYDSGRDACVKVLLALANQVERLEGRVERLAPIVHEETAPWVFQGAVSSV